MAGKRRPKKSNRKKSKGKGNKKQAKAEDIVQELVPALPTFSITPPPIYMANIANIKELVKNLKEITCEGEFLFRITSVSVRLMIKTPDSYKEVIEHLKVAQYEFHTFKLRDRKPLRVVVRGLHVDTKPEELEKDLSERGYMPKDVSRVVHPITGKELPLFYVDLEPGARNRTIYELKTVGCQEVHVEKPRQRREVVQCHRCQGYGHTRNYCHRLVRCVRCAGGHDWRQCEKRRDSAAVCANCEGDHPANWRGCPAHKEARKNRKRQRRLALVSKAAKCRVKEVSPEP
ncbi:hypothetical protein AAG570_005261 [Ranatra chinensis]|uniref:Pre-C2HC domain-containing protein n=1 Tax=Ranatra chinensis TaxID=642074 RepID=A0ABD0YLQ5_9HEMI